MSRHTVVVLLVALGVCLAGMSLSVVAFGQSTTSDPDATVPTGDYTSTTPAQSTSPYTTTQPKTTTTVVTTPTDTGESAPATTHGTKPKRVHGSTTPTVTPVVPSRATRSGPTHLAFTGGEPILVGVAGAGLMLGGLALHRRRLRRAA